MKKVETIQITAHETERTSYLCDTCGKQVVDRTWGRMKQCQICKGDVCKDCAVITDHWYLEDGSFCGDYPDYYCPKCWDLGKMVREQIQEARDKETALWEDWHKLGSTEGATNETD